MRTPPEEVETRWVPEWVSLIKVSTSSWADLEDDVERGVEDHRDDSPVHGDVRDKLRSGRRFA